MDVRVSENGTRAVRRAEPAGSAGADPGSAGASAGETAGEPDGESAGNPAGEPATDPADDAAGLGIDPDDLPDGLVVADGTGQVICFNAAAARITRLHPRDVLGRPVDHA